MTPLEKEFLRESNAIEGVYDEDSFRQAVIAWTYLKKQKVLTTSVVLKTHKLLMLHSDLRPNEKGYFRIVRVYVGGREGAPWREVPELMRKWTFEGLRSLPEIDPKFLHVEYEKIHPFVDGNGRTGRMFMNWQLVKKLKKPLLIIHAGPEQQEYYKWFK
jgi:Fic family protein